MRRLLVAGVAAGLVTLVLFVGNRTSRHPGLTTRRLSDDADRHAVDACEYCERLTRDWEKRVCRILSSGAEDHSFFAGYFSGIPATATRKPRYECANGRFVSFRRLDVLRVNRVLAKCEIPACGAVQAVIDNCPGRTPDFLPLLPENQRHRLTALERDGYFTYPRGAFARELAHDGLARRLMTALDAHEAAQRRSGRRLRVLRAADARLGEESM